MLYNSFGVIKENIAVKKINGFLYSPYYMLLAALLMAASNIFAIEFAVFYIYTALTLYTVLLSPDTFPIMPLVCCGYMLISAKNNPITNYEDNILASEDGAFQLTILLAVIILSVLSRFVYEIVTKKRYKDGMPQLTWGFLLLGTVYIFGGILSPYYSLRTLFFGFVEILSLCATYFFFYMTVDFRKRRAHEIAFMFSAVGIGLVLQIVGMYLTPEVIRAIADGRFDRSMLVSGWGVYNNVGLMMAMMIPAPFYLAVKNKYHGVWIILASLFMLATVFTQSRGSMLAAAAIFILCVLFMLGYSDRRVRIINLLTLLGVAIAAALLLSFVFREHVESIFALLQKKDFFDDSNRSEYYNLGIQSFLNFPLFGVGFYVGQGELFQVGENLIPSQFFMPPGLHNTYVQLLASCGFIGMLVYFYHRVQTIWIVVKDATSFKVFMSLSIAIIVLTSIVDCHFFNLGPGLTYGVLLVCIEKIQLRGKEPKIVI